MTNTKNYIGSVFYDSTFKLAKQLYFDKWGNVTNCLQAEGNLQEANNELAEREAMGITTEPLQAQYDALLSLIGFLNKYLEMNCKPVTETPPPVMQPLPSTDTPYPDPIYDDGTGYPEPGTDTGSNKMTWIAGAGLIAFIIWNNTKRKRNRKRSK